MKLYFLLFLLVASASAQTGPKASTTSKRVLICCGKATNQISTPSSAPSTKPSSSNATKQ